MNGLYFAKFGFKNACMMLSASLAEIPAKSVKFSPAENSE